MLVLTIVVFYMDKMKKKTQQNEQTDVLFRINFSYSLARYHTLPETAGLHGETPSSRYGFTCCLRLIFMARISQGLEIPFPFSTIIL